ncbi:hypothetical protein [Streptomyces sp. NPDC058612]|uniref:hypothetical protein n=1 Tax=Streptomyces sp. NPDC058612 TaxID=3346555 RepID=UPI003661F4EA
MNNLLYLPEGPAAVQTRARQLALTAAAIAALAAFSAYTATASADTPPPAAEPQMSFAVEDFTYPDAAQILADQGIKLIRGDGKITLTACDNNAKQIRVYAKEEPGENRRGTYCFTAHGNSGQLSLELTRVFLIDAADHPLSASLTTNGVTKTVTIPKDEFISVGEGVIGGSRSVLVELRVTG